MNSHCNGTVLHRNFDQFLPQNRIFSEEGDVLEKKINREDGKKCE